MLDYNYYDNLRKACIVPEHIRKMFEDHNKIGKICMEMFLPFIRVTIYAATHEPQLFSDLMEKMNNAQNLPFIFHIRVPYEELLPSLGLLGDECLMCLLSKLDCSDPVFNGLRDSIINHDLDAFEKVMKEWGGSFSQVTPICRLLYLEVSINNFVERTIKESDRINKITDLNQQSQEFKAYVRKVFDNYDVLFKKVFNDEFCNGLNETMEKTFDEYTQKLTIDTRNFDDLMFDMATGGFVSGVLSANPNAKLIVIEKAPKDFFYKILLNIYDILVAKRKNSISQPAKRVIEEILFVPEYETIWKQYEDSGIDLIEDEIFSWAEVEPTPQIGEPVSQESISTISDTTWHLPIDFFDKSYLDDCDINEYIPCFLEDQLKIAAVVNDKLTDLKERLNVVFQDFIETLAGEGCIDNDYLTKASFAHALTGRKVDVEIKKVKWKYSQSTKDKGWLNNIYFIASKLYPRYIYDKNHNKLKKIDQIKKVFDLDHDSLTLEKYQKINPEKFSPSYGVNADDFVKNAVEKFLNSVEIIKISIGA